MSYRTYNPFRPVRHMSPRREQVLAFIQAYIGQHPYPPTVREIADGCGINTTTAQHHLVVLRELGRIKRTPGSRTIELVMA